MNVFTVPAGQQFTLTTSYVGVSTPDGVRTMDTERELEVIATNRYDTLGGKRRRLFLVVGETTVNGSHELWVADDGDGDGKLEPPSVEPTEHFGGRLGNA
jgi:hypothetical protein